MRPETEKGPHKRTFPREWALLGSYVAGARRQRPLIGSRASVPTGNFNAAPYAAKWTIPEGSGATWSTTIKASTGGTYVFRAAPAA